ncbi:Golgi SNAP receptor complex member 2 [Polyergus mexicanus]|uniref:Golgi SNAP receptor complex member 2 n=1 Tax=Polyergus mexicanus TaxID=615972 RepID=UPI0038B56AD2
METLYHQTNKLIQETQHLFSQLERKSSNADLQEVKESIRSKLNLINSNCERLDVLCLKGPVSQRQNARMRVDQLKYDSRHLAAALNSLCTHMTRQQKEEAEREALLARKFTSNDHVDILIDHTLQHSNSMHNAIHGIDDLLYQGSSVLDNLKSQRVTLKGAHKRLIDIGNILGLSNTTMRLIEQRAKQDGFILVAGMTFTCIIIILVIVYLT